MLAFYVNKGDGPRDMAIAPKVVLSERQRIILERWTRNRVSTPARLVERSRIVLMAAHGMSNTELAERLDVDQQRAGRWRRRWAANQERLADAERQSPKDKDLARLIREILSDNPRSGTPSKFSAEELAQIISVACELPEDSNRPVSHWTPSELAQEVVKRGIVESISPRHIDRFLKTLKSDRTKADTG